MIDKFEGEYDWLSNFYDSPVSYGSVIYRNNEAAFQAQKTLDPKKRLEFKNLPAGKSKRLGRQVTLRSDWEEVKDNIMYEIILAKFRQNAVIRGKLLLTGKEELVEGNWWKDVYWGVCDGVGQNKLGIILMRVREELKS